MITRWNLPYTVTRQTTARTFVKGREVPPATTQFEVQATIQPITGREVLKLPEGERSENQIKIYSATKLNVATEAGIAGDVITYDSDDFEIVAVENWNKFNGIKHFKMRARRIDPNAADRQQ